MAWVWTPVGIAGLVAAALAATAAVIVFASNPGRTQNRLLAAFLALLASVSASGTGLMYETSLARDAYAWQAVWVVVEFPFLCAYVAFLSTLPTAFARPLQRARPALYVIGLLAPLLYFARREQFLASEFPGAFSPWDVAFGPWGSWLVLAGAFTSALGIVVALAAWTRAKKGSLARSQARAYLAAFAVLDGATAIVYGRYFLSNEDSEWNLILLRAATSAFVLLLAYGILKSQLFDIDLKVKWTLRRGTVAAVFVGAFFIVAEVAKNYLTGALGWLVGGIAAGALLLVLRPIERAADRLADRAMPHVEATPAYAAFRKMEVYKAAVEEVLADGVMSEKDRRVLDRLRAQLGLRAEDVHALERDVASARGAA